MSRCGGLCPCSDPGGHGRRVGVEGFEAVAVGAAYGREGVVIERGAEDFGAVAED